SPGPRSGQAEIPRSLGKASLMATTVGRSGRAAIPQQLGDQTAARLTLEDRLELLRYMLLMRGIEQRAMTLYRQGKVPGSFYDGFGQEAVSAGAACPMA